MVPNTGPPGVVLRTFLISDIRGYSTFTRERGDEAAARLATRFAELARDTVEARGGEVIELRGDEALAVFDSTPQALRAGVELQEACREATAEDPDLPLSVGVGIDSGEAIPVEDGYRGVALNMAARLCSKAKGGQVLVTERVVAIRREVGELIFESQGAVELKGFDRPVELYAVQSPDGGLPTSSEAVPTQERVPPELEESSPLVGREHEVRWLRGTWRQIRRGHGRVVFISGPAGIGKTRLAAEATAYAHASGGSVRYAGGGGAGGGEALTAIADARSTTVPTLFVLDDLDLYEECFDALRDSLKAIESRPVLVVGLFHEAEGQEALAEIVDLIDIRGDGHRRLGPLGLDGVNEIARAYVGDVEGLPAESMLRSSGGVPARVHELVTQWARDEAQRRLGAAAEWFAAGKTKHAAGLEFANNVIALKLGNIYRAPGKGHLDGSCPYKGLAAFESSDSAYFYGRERLVGELAARTVGMGLLGVAGPSGSGKSSVVMAGLLPSLVAGLLPGSERWDHAIMRPGEHPVAELDAALDSRYGSERLILVVDQFEEIFTMTADEVERATFVDRLVRLADDPDGAVVVVTIRADYAGHLAHHPQFAELFSSNLVLVGPMSPDELRRAIELPARRVGLRVESSLRESLVEEIGEEPGGLPLLSTALVELWQARQEGWLRLESHASTGGVRGAVARLAEASYEQLSEPEQDVARIVLLRLVGEGEGDAAVRRRVPVSELDIESDPVVAAVVARLTADRLLTRDDGMIEIAHEALVREWPRLNGWLKEDATGRQLSGHLTQSSKQWMDRDRDPGELYRGARLTATLDWAREHGRELNALEREFLEQGRQAGEREAERQRRTNRRLRTLLAGTAIFLVAALIAGGLALVQRSNARSAQTAAEAQALRADAERLGTLAQSDSNLDRSMLLAVAGVGLDDLPETRGDLLAVLQKTPALFQILHPSRNETSAMAIGPDNRLVASGDSAGVVRFHRLGSAAQVGAPVQLEGAVSEDAMVFSPNGNVAAVAAATGNRSNVYAIDVQSRKARLLGSWPSVNGPPGAPLRFSRVAFSPDGERLAVAVATAAPSDKIPPQRLLVLDPSSGGIVWQRPYPLVPGQLDAFVAFTRRGELVTSAAYGKTLLWNARTGRVERTFPIGGPLAVSPDGNLAALAQLGPDPFNQSSSLAVLDLRSGEQRSLGDLPASAWIVSLEFTGDGKSIVGASTDGALRVWDLGLGSIIETFTGQPSGLNLAVSPNGQTVLSGAGNGTVAAWDLSGTERLGRLFRRERADTGCSSTPCFVIDPQNDHIAYALQDGTVALLDARNLRTQAVLQTEGVNALAFFPDGGTLVTGDGGGGVALWDVRTRSVRRRIPFADPVWWVAVSPNGKLLAVQTKGDDDSARVEVRDVKGEEVLFSEDVPNGGGALYFSPDGTELAALGCCEPDSTIQVWDALSGRKLFSPKVEGHATTIAFSPDGRELAVGTEDGRVVLWNAEDGALLGPPFQVAIGAIDPISFSPDGRLIAASSNDQTTTLWDLESRKRLGNSFPIYPASIPVSRFAPDGDLVIDNVTATEVWPTELEAWKHFACRVAGRDLTRAEWTDLLPDRPYRSVCPQ